jgi:hypothetical protein
MQLDLRRNVQPAATFARSSPLGARGRNAARGSSFMDGFVIGRAFARRIGRRCRCLVRARVFARCGPGGGSIASD